MLVVETAVFMVVIEDIDVDVNIVDVVVVCLCVLVVGFVVAVVERVVLPLQSSSWPSLSSSGPAVGFEHSRLNTGSMVSWAPPPQAQHAVTAVCPSAA